MVYEKKVLGLAEAQAAVDAVIAEASKDQPDRPIAVAVADSQGDLICLAKMDGCHALALNEAINKAYTAGRWCGDTFAIENRTKGTGRIATNFGDSRYTFVQGGLVIMYPDNQLDPEKVGTVRQVPPHTAVGGIGVCGRPSGEDERLAFVGIQAIKY